MNVGLFIPCYIDQFYPQVGIACMQILKRHGVEVSYPANQTCCGQPMANSGFNTLTSRCNKNFIQNFNQFDFVVSPSGSCVLHIKEHLDSPDKHQAKNLKEKVYEFTEFLVDILKIKHLTAKFPFVVGFHISCHGQRGLKLSSMSELVENSFSKPEYLLNLVEGLKMVYPERIDECCGFGGTFCVFEESVSVKMGKDRIREHEKNAVQYITSVDSSCLMHLEGIIKRQKKNIQIVHVAEILNAV